jgi:large subunit ribosomal protein L4
MAVIDVLNSSGKKVSQRELSDDLFNVPAKKSVLHEVVNMQLSNRRSGTAAVKHRSDVTGSTHKLFRQKGTGRARRGDIKSPLLRGGGVVFGPDGRKYAHKVPKKVKKLALKMALSSKLQSNKLVVLDRLELDQIKTKAFWEICKALKVKNALIVTDKKNDNLEMSSRNVPTIKVLRSEGLNVYDILKYESLVLLESAISDIEGRLRAS